MSDLRIGWIGIGRMGLPMTTRLLKAGHQVTVWNRTRAKAEPLVKLGAVIAEKIADLRTADVVFTVLTTGKDAAAGYDPKAAVTLTWWTGQTETAETTAEQLAAQYHALHPNVTITFQTIQNEALDGKLQTALNSNSAPDVFFQVGGGKMRAQVDAGELAFG